MFNTQNDYPATHLQQLAESREHAGDPKFHFSALSCAGATQRQNVE